AGVLTSRPASAEVVDRPPRATSSAWRSDGLGGANDTEPSRTVSMRANVSGRAMDSMGPGRATRRLSCDPRKAVDAARRRLFRLVGEQRPDRQRIGLPV